MAEKPFLIRSKPGIQRDGTRYDSDSYVDGLWTRFDRGKPRKVGGYQRVTPNLVEKVYGMSSFSSNALQYLHLGSNSKLYQGVVNNAGGLSSLNDRSPVGLVASANNLWQLDVLPNAVAQTSSIIAFGAPNLADISSTAIRKIWYNADVTALTVLIDTGLDQVSGGIVAIGPYLFSYGNAGYISNTAPNDPTTPDATARVTGQKVIKGLPLRGNGSGPSGIFWSLDSLIRATFNASGSGPTFAYDTITDNISVMSDRAIIEYDGVYYWWGTDRPMMFNGVVQEVPNFFNVDFFLDDFDFSQRQKVFAFKVPRFGEIWWCFPKDGATECNHAVVYNVRDRIWYDTALPDGGRSSGIYAKVYNKPFMTGVQQLATGYELWQHETGTDKVAGTQVDPVQAYFETATLSLQMADEADNGSLRVARVEPDFVQTGDMTLEVTGSANSRSPIVTSAPVSFPDTASTPEQQTVMLREIRRLMRFRFASNTPGGYFYMGRVFGHVDRADGRVTS